jgi:exodeoxyribonuclease VII large subunit
LRAAARALPDADEVLAVPRQRVDHAVAALTRALRANAQIHRVDFSRIGGRLNSQLLRATVERRRERFSGFAHRLQASVAANTLAHRTRIARERERIVTFAHRAERAVGVILDRRFAQAERAGQLLAAFSYRGVLARGFALVRDGAGEPLRAAAAVSTGMRLEIEFSDGRVGAVAGDARVTPEAAPAPVLRRRRRRSDGGEGQGTLF